MIGLVVTGHGHFADGIHTSAQMIAGENDYVRYINFEEGMTPEQLAEKFNAAFDEFKSCDGVVVLSDLPGGSPFKTAVECKYARPEQKIEVIAGTNLPMIVTAVTMLDMEDDPLAVVYNHDCEGIEELADYPVQIKVGADMENVLLGLDFILFAQTIALMKSLSLGITPDTPAPPAR